MGRQVIWAERALLPEGWAEAVRLEIAEGRIAEVAPGAAPEGTRADVLLPAPANCHSHAFQRAMAGLAERRSPAGRDSFWTWRKLMYRFLETLTPEQVEAIAAMVQMEMLEAGFGASVEFHYLHHQPDGTPYDDPAEMGARIAAAAARSGIGLTLLPVLYSQGGCDGRALEGGQRRFGSDLEGFARLLEGASAALADLPGDCHLGAAPHSLRAVPPAALSALPGMVGEAAPLHMHLAEQQAEVEEVRAALGAHPVDWALAEMELGPRWCLIHCTQMSPDQAGRLARSGATAGLCPLTEANLGDGIFQGTAWAEAGGALAVGSDSNIRISLAEELRQLDTSQRLRDGSRAALARPGGSAGRWLLEAAAAGGARAAGRGAGRIAPGAWADLLALGGAHPDLAGLPGDLALDSFVFAGDSAMVQDVWSGGRHMVRGGRHIAREAIVAGYRRATAGLRAAL